MDNLEQVRTRYQRSARGDFSAVTDTTAGEDYEFVAGPELPDAGSYRGEDARRRIAPWFDSFQGLTSEPTEIVDAGDKVFSGMIQRGRPHGSQNELEGRWWAVDTFRDGVLVRTEVFPDRAQAVEAAGLRE